MIKIEFTKEEIKKLKYERFNNPSSRVQLKMEALYLKSMNLKHSIICNICGISRVTFVSYLKIYLDGGIKALKQNNYKGKRNLLLENATVLKNYFGKHPPVSLKEAKAKILELVDLNRSLPQIREFFYKINFKRYKVKAIPGKAATKEKQKEQEDFLKKELMPRINEAEKGGNDFFLWMPHTLYIKHF